MVRFNEATHVEIIVRVDDVPYMIGTLRHFQRLPTPARTFDPLMAEIGREFLRLAGQVNQEDVRYI